MSLDLAFLGPSGMLLRSLMLQEFLSSPVPGCLQLPARKLCVLTLSETCLLAPYTTRVGISMCEQVCVCVCVQVHLGQCEC